MDPDSRFQMYRHWSMSGHIDHNNRRTSLLKLLTGEEPADSKLSADDAVRRAAKIVLTELGHFEKDVNLVPKEVGFMMRYRGGKAVDVWMGNYELAPPLADGTLYWLGKDDTGASIELLELLTKSVGDPELRTSIWVSPAFTDTKLSCHSC